MPSLTAEISLKDTEFVKQALGILYEQLIDSRVPNDYKEKIIELIKKAGD